MKSKEDLFKNCPVRTPFVRSVKHSAKFKHCQVSGMEEKEGRGREAQYSFLPAEETSVNCTQDALSH